MRTRAQEVCVVAQAVLSGKTQVIALVGPGSPMDASLTSTFSAVVSPRTEPAG